MCNPRGTPREFLWCPYHHIQFCTLLNHASYASTLCMIKIKTITYIDYVKCVIINEKFPKQLYLDAKSSGEMLFYVVEQ